jgi:hypothetical protein
MRKTIKLLGIAVIIAVIGFSMAACGDDIPTTGGGPHTHSWGDWRSNASQHWKECSCGAEYGRASHEFSGNICSVCNYNSSTGVQGTNPTVTTTSLPNGTVGTAYSQTLTAAGATPITWSIDTGSLPGGLTLSNAGVISGTPTTANTFTFTVKATNATGSGTKSLSITITSIGGGGNTTVTIVNNTTYAIMDVRIKPSTSNNWGNDLESSSIVNGSSRAYTISRSSVDNKYDIRLMEYSTDTGGNNFRKYNVTVSNGMTVTFNAADLDNGSNLPVIYIRNRTGIEGTSFRLRPSGTSDWTEYPSGAVSNNNSGNEGKGTSLNMVIPLSNYSVFDFELLSANPVNTFTKNNVTIANGTILTFTSAQAATPIAGYPTIVIENNTGETWSGLNVAASGASSWGANFLPVYLYNGQSFAVTLSQTLAVQDVYHIRGTYGSLGYVLSSWRKNNVTVTEGMIVTFTAADKE